MGLYNTNSCANKNVHNNSIENMKLMTKQPLRLTDTNNVQDFLIYCKSCRQRSELVCFFLFFDLKLNIIFSDATRIHEHCYYY
jgi:hypothetical protein